MDVDPISRVCLQDYDYILIAILAPSTIKCIKKELFDFGVPDNKILSVSVTQEQINMAYDKFISF